MKPSVLQFPTQIITEKAGISTRSKISIETKKSYMRSRSYSYPDDKKGYIDTTYYDKEDEQLDLGYQRLRVIHVNYYHQFSFLKKLFIDHNNLMELPDPKYLPKLEQLTCSHNNLSTIPFYPHCIFLNISNNKIKSCSQYAKSKLKYFDCSFNDNFKLDFSLDICTHLYINDNNLYHINLDLVPSVKYVDCSNNNLTVITGVGKELLEMNIQQNLLKVLPPWPNIIRLMADNNHISILPTFSKMLSVNISHNKLTVVKSQPLLTKLIADNNLINMLGDLPKVQLLDVSYNAISSNLRIPDTVEYVSIQYNPITDIILSATTLRNIKELQVNFETYKYIYDKYYSNFDAITVQINEQKLEELLKRLDSVFDAKTIRYVFKTLNGLDFKNREKIIFKVALKIYYDFFPLDGISTLNALASTTEFKYLYHNMTKVYYKCVVVTLFFNGYYN